MSAAAGEPGDAKIGRGHRQAGPGWKGPDQHRLCVFEVSE